MSHRALGEQFVSHADIAKMYSGDHDVLMSHALPEMVSAEQEGFDHPRAVEHGGSAGYVDHLAKDIAANGISKPLDVRGGNVITDGHHRALAAMKLKLDRVPVLHYE